MQASNQRDENSQSLRPLRHKATKERIAEYHGEVTPYEELDIGPAVGRERFWDEAADG